MKRNVKAPEVEARLHRSLSNQVRVPQLDRRFDAAVWARIEAEEQKQAQPLAAPAKARRSGAERWLQLSNFAGLGVASVLLLVFGFRMLGGSGMGASLPGISLAVSPEMTQVIAWSVTIAAVAQGAMFTPLGRWLRAEFSWG